MKDLIIWIEEPNRSLFTEHDIYKEALYTPGLSIDREAAAIEKLIERRVAQQLRDVTPKRWNI